MAKRKTVVPFHGTAEQEKARRELIGPLVAEGAALIRDGVIFTAVFAADEIVVAGGTLAAGGFLLVGHRKHRLV